MVVQAEEDGDVAATSTRRHSTSSLVFCLTSSISGGWLACFSFLLLFILKPHYFLILFLCLCNLPFLVTLPVSFKISSLANIRAVVVAPRLTCIAFGLLWAEEECSWLLPLYQILQVHPSVMHRIVRVLIWLPCACMLPFS